MSDFDYRQCSDHELLESVAGGNRDAFSVLYDRHSSRMYGLVLKLLADPVLATDALQEVFINIWKYAARYSRLRGSAVVWMNFICRNRCIDLLRSRKVRIDTLHVDWEILQALEDRHTPNPLQATQQAIVGEQLEAAMKKLPEEQRQLLKMAYIEGYSQSEIAARLKLPIGTVKSRIRLGLGKMRDGLLPENSDDR